MKPLPLIKGVPINLTIIPVIVANWVSPLLHVWLIEQLLSKTVYSWALHGLADYRFYLWVLIERQVWVFFMKHFSSFSIGSQVTIHLADEELMICSK